MILLKKEQTREKEIRARRQFEDVTQEVLKSQVFFFVLLKDLVASASDCNRMANRVPLNQFSKSKGRSAALKAARISYDQTNNTTWTTSLKFH